MPRAFVVTAPGAGRLEHVPRAVPGPGDVLVEVARVGLCGTDAEFWRGTQPYLFDGGASFPLRLGHEWCGRVVQVGVDVDRALLGSRVTGDTMLGCQRCTVCRRGRQHLCPERSEIGVLRGRPGALADELTVPAHALHELPDAVDDVVGALVEPASLALRCVRTAGARAGDRIVVHGLGAIGLLVTAFAAQAGLEVHAVGRRQSTLELALELGAASAWTTETLPDGLRFEAGVGASPDPAVPSLLAGRLEPGGQVVLAGISGAASLLEMRSVVVGDLRVTGLLSGSPVFAETIDVLAAGGFDAAAVVGGTFPLEQAGEVLAGTLAGAGRGPKTQIAIRPDRA